MKSPAEWIDRLRSQWQRPTLREQRLLNPSAWPLELMIGKPGAEQIASGSAQLKQHLQAWRQQHTGDVIWQDISYRCADAPVSVPVRWRLHHPSEWIAACNDTRIKRDYELLKALIAQVDQRFHGVLIRQLALLRERPLAEIEQVVEVALELRPGMAQGLPLRAIPVGADSKFLERNRALLVKLLEQRFPGEVSTQGLEAFLGATPGQDHWLLVAALAPGLLPFEQQRVRARELQHKALPARHILVVENIQCLHLLPPLDDAIAVLGAGLDLGWLQAEWLAQRHLAYWGDLDTWGLAMLGRARLAQSGITPLLMEKWVFEK